MHPAYVSSSLPWTGVFLGGRYAADEVIAYGGIPEAFAKGVRSSARLRAQDNADDTQLERAQKRLRREPLSVILLLPQVHAFFPSFP